MTEPSHHYREKGTLILALVAGLSINGSFSALFSALVPFSIFPLIALVLSVYCLHQRYVDRSMSESAPLLVAASFLLGLLLYSAIVRVEYPAIGSNFIPSLLCVALVLWIGLRLKSRAAADEGDAPEA
ncbi:YijD family membrane protein [Brenneria populi]|uniref:YijD family membrane protein n=1 Tax=Brenneria populi TaxID=1505588 RepID=A0ABU6JRX3_9GAMM|nr:YijD family membrane protein [Brenneria populi Li et al. 2015]